MNWIESKLTQDKSDIKDKTWNGLYKPLFHTIIILLYIYHTLEEKTPITFWISFQKMIIIRQIQLISNFKNII